MTRVFFIFLIAALFVIAVPAQKLKPEEIVAKHLESIGTSEKRAAAKSLMAVGDAVVTFVTSKNQTAAGRIVIASEGDKLFFGLNLNAADYPEEKFAFDGKNAEVGYVRTTQRSALGNFVLSNKLLIEDSLFGGVLATSWALNALDSKTAKLTSGGIKKIDGKEVYVLNYSPKGGSDIDITLFFEKETFRHVRTEYKRVSSAGIGVRPEQSSGFIETRIKLTENFADFRNEGGLTLPHTYMVNYSISGQNGTSEVSWGFLMTAFVLNQKIEPETFTINQK